MFIEVLYFEDFRIYLNMKFHDLKKYYSQLDRLEIALIAISFLFILFSFFAPIIFAQKSIFFAFPEGSETIGDTIGGIMNPFIGIAAVLVTFLAFYIQFKANQQQLKNFRKELDLNKFENQYYEMLRLHKENVNELSISCISEERLADNIYRNVDVIKGREVFQYYLEELALLYNLIKVNMPDILDAEVVVYAYRIFFQGREEVIRSTRNDHPNWMTVFNRLNDLTKLSKISNESKFTLKVREFAKHEPKLFLNYQLFSGKSAVLAHYYRHLFQTVKFVTSQSDEIADYEEKRNYLRILRSQLSNHEQALLLYNWKSHYGGNWEDERNKFFSDYRMIHNLNSSLIFDEYKLEDLFHYELTNLKKEKNREKDPMFEFQDWD